MPSRSFAWRCVAAFSDRPSFTRPARGVPAIAGSSLRQNAERRSFFGGSSPGGSTACTAAAYRSPARRRHRLFEERAQRALEAADELLEERFQTAPQRKLAPDAGVARASPVRRENRAEEDRERPRSEP